MGLARGCMVPRRQSIFSPRLFAVAAGKIHDIQHTKQQLIKFKSTLGTNN